MHAFSRTCLFNHFGTTDYWTGPSCTMLFIDGAARTALALHSDDAAAATVMLVDTENCQRKGVLSATISGRRHEGKLKQNLFKISDNNKSKQGLNSD